MTTSPAGRALTTDDGCGGCMFRHLALIGRTALMPTEYEARGTMLRGSCVSDTIISINKFLLDYRSGRA